MSVLEEELEAKSAARDKVKGRVVSAHSKSGSSSEAHTTP